MQVFSNYFSKIDHVLQESVYETNQSSRLQLPEGAESMVFHMNPPGPAIRSSLDDLCSNLEALLGSDRWALLNPDRWEMAHYEQVRLLGYSQYMWDDGQDVAANIFVRDGAEPTVSFTGEHGIGTSALPLKWFLPQNHRKTPLNAYLDGYPKSLMTPLSQWVTAQAVRLQKPTD